MPPRSRKPTDTPKEHAQAERGPNDRPDDPLLVPDLAALGLEATREVSDRGGDAYAKVLESICGAVDDSQPVEQYDGTLGVTIAFVAAHQRPVAQVQWNANLATIYTNPGNVSGVRWGTGTMISPDLFLTAGHLFDQTGGGWARPRQNGTMNVISPQEIATNMHLNFDFQVDAAGNPRVEQSFAIVQLIEYRLGGVDFAVCRIAGSPGITFGWTDISAVDATVGDMVAIIGHPAGLMKRIEAGPVTAFSGNEIRYDDIDTLGGNSGSGIIQASTGNIVGVHTNGGCDVAAIGFNFGMRISSIRAASPTVQNLGAPTNPVADKSIIDDIRTNPRDDILKSIIDDIRTNPRDDILTLPDQDKQPFDDIRTNPRDDILTLPDQDKQPFDDIIVTRANQDKQPLDDIILTRPNQDKGVIDDLGTVKNFDDIKAPMYDKPVADDLGGFKLVRDDLGGFKGIGDVKAPGYDKGFDDPGYRDPGGLRPFLLATPHHAAVVGANQAAGALGYDTVLAQLAAAIGEQQRTLMELTARLEALSAERRGSGGSPTA